MFNADYLNRRDKLALEAHQHTKEMENQYSDEIEECIKNSIIWSADDQLLDITLEQYGIVKHADLSAYHNAEKKVVSFKILQNTTDEAIMKSYEEHIAILNFASYKNPGGGFLSGCTAQEEWLCHYSYLFNILSKLSKYYEWNNAHLNKGMYTNRAVYTPNVRFFDSKGNSRLADVITCAAPNKSLLFRYNAFSEEENNLVLENRINFIKLIAYLSNPKTENIILGAWGCGVFRQDPVLVCNLFTLAFLNSTYNTVIYAIPDNKTYKIFLNTFNDNKALKK